MNTTTEKTITVELVRTNFFTRHPCHATGSYTEKVPILAEVTEGEYKGFRVGEDCLRRENVEAEMMAYADKLERRAAELRQLAPRLKVPTWREYRLAELQDAVEQTKQQFHELGRVYANRDQFRNLFAHDALRFIESMEQQQDTSLTSEEIAAAFGVDPEDVMEEQCRRAEEAGELVDDIPW